MTPQWKIQSEWTESRHGVTTYKFKVKLEGFSNLKQADSALCSFIKQNNEMYNSAENKKLEMVYDYTHNIIDVTFNDEADSIMFKLKYT